MRIAALLLVVGATLSGCGGGSTSGAQRHTTETTEAHPRTETLQAPHRVRDHYAPVPILVYHVIGSHPEGSSLEGLYVPPAELRDQVDWLARNGFHTVTLGQLARYWLQGVALPHRPIVLSFDDGYPGDWRYALPILMSRHFVGVLNLQIGNLVPLRVRQLLAAGWEVDSHTFTHPDLRSVSDAQLTREVAASRLWLERVFRIPVPAFCYPYGFFDARVVAAVRRAGYVLAETEQPGWAAPSNGLLTLDRIRVLPDTGVTGLAADLHSSGA